MISIIIPTFNRCSSLKKTIESIIKYNLDFSKYEILIIDNGSTDNTKQISENFISQNIFLNIRYYYDSVPGLLTGRHKGAELAQGDILTFIDDDVEVSETWLEAIIDVMKSKPEVSLLTGPCLPNYEINPPEWLEDFWTKDINGIHCGWLSLMDFGNLDKEIDPAFVWGLNFTIRKKDLYELGGFHPDNLPAKFQMYQGDGETGLSLKAKCYNKKAWYCSKVRLFHQVSKDRLTLEYFKKRSYYQGVADSYTELKNYPIDKERTSSLIKKLKRIVKKYLNNPKNELPLEESEMIKILNLAYIEGKKFHKAHYINNDKVKSWVDKNDYFDYNFLMND